MSAETVVGKARAPYLLTSFGPGSIVNQGSYAVMPVSSDFWGPLKEMSAPLFKRDYDIERLIDLSAMAHDKRAVKTILFPDEFYCSACGLIQKPAKDTIGDARHLRCGAYSCSGELVVSRYVQYCSKGHIDRFDYRFFVHEFGIKCDKPVRIDVRGVGTVSTIKCDCGATKRVEFGKGSGAGKCFGRMPWLYRSEQCNELVRVTMRSSSDIYYSATRSSIVIEPESDPEVAKVLQVLVEFDSAMIDSDLIHKVLDGSRLLVGVPSKKKARALAYIRSTSYTDVVGTAKRIEFDEFQAFSSSAGEKGSDLWVQQCNLTPLMKALGFDGLSAVRKLREVRAIVGFNRGGQAPDPAFDGAAYETPVVISDKKVALGYENRGEGIFLRFSAPKLRNWLERPAVQRRATAFLRAETRWRAESKKRIASERRMIYVFVHTFAHLLIRSISLDCGYSQTSLRERVLTSADEADPWAGVLLYTSTSDADGSLGGLVSLALDPGRLDTILTHALTNTAICSSDPICAVDEPGRYANVNGAACHACCIVPEPCCQRGNRFLDRNLVTPKTLHPETADLCYFALDG